jgi:transcriptional regulator NrdR family protein
MKCPVCETWTTVKETRARKTDGVVTRRYECGNLHRFSTEERIRYDERLYESGKDWAANARSGPTALKHLA